MTKEPLEAEPLEAEIHQQEGSLNSELPPPPDQEPGNDRDMTRTMVGASVVIVFLVLASWASGIFDEEGRGPWTPDDDVIIYDPVVPDPDTYYDDLREFTDYDPDFYDDNGSLKWEALSARNWSVFNRDEGGNCCEHYLAATKEGWIVNLGGEYPVWSEDRGKTWETYVPTVLPSGINDQHELCRTLEPSGLEDWEGLGEGSVVQATNGDLLAMSWYPYPSYDGKADRFYAYLYRADLSSWSWCQNNWHEPFYDRSWQVEVKGPITTDPNGLPGDWPWASIVISNFWHQSANAGGAISVDGLNYYRLDFPGRNGNAPLEVFDLNFTDLGVEWDYAMPHREMRAIPLPGPENGGPGGVLFPNYFTDGDNAWLDTDLNWHRHQVSSGERIPSEYLWLDSSGTLHSLERDGGNGIHHWMSTDGGNSWSEPFTYSWPTAQSVDEWEFQADGTHDLYNLFQRVQEQDSRCPEGSSPCDRDLLFQVRGYSQNRSADNVVFVGLGDKDSTSGAGNDIRFDFASMAILPDGGVVAAYHDSTDEDPLFAVEVELPREYFVTV